MAFDTSQFREFRYGWPVVLASTFGISLGMSPLPFYTIGVFAQPLAEEFGWGIDQIMLGLVPFCVVTVISAPMAGYLSDRYGVRKVALISMLTFFHQYSMQPKLLLETPRKLRSFYGGNGRSLEQ